MLRQSSNNSNNKKANKAEIATPRKASDLIGDFSRRAIPLTFAKKMKFLTASTITFCCAIALCQCESPDAQGIDSQNTKGEPELALCMMVLKVVNGQTGEPVSIKTVNFRDSGIETYTSTVPVSRTIITRVVPEEGLIFSSWVAPINGLGGLEIAIEGFDSIIVNPLKGEIHIGFSYSESPTFSEIQRTIELKKSNKPEMATPMNPSD